MCRDGDPVSRDHRAASQKEHRGVSANEPEKALEWPVFGEVSRGGAGAKTKRKQSEAALKKVAAL
jgi:hypothetical protein